jgi:hypothetical protein
MDTCVESGERVEREQQLVEADLRVRENRTGLVVGRSVIILTEVR